MGVSFSKRWCGKNTDVINMQREYAIGKEVKSHFCPVFPAVHTPRADISNVTCTSIGRAIGLPYGRPNKRE